ncbi:MAG: ComF family protein [Acidimicrobiales bacterium]
MPSVLRVLLTLACPMCGAPGRAPCAACTQQLRPAPQLPPPVGVDACLALLAYDGAGRELVARLKYHNQRGALAGLARAMASLVADPASIDVVTWAPTTAQRRRQRGFDQAELLARPVARALHRPCRALLVRQPGPPQTGLSLAERRGGPHLQPRRAIPGWSVLVVDDVVTSGSTAAVAALALRRGGASSVVVLAAARTPRPSRAGSTRARAPQ